jgi:hypothetical protein
VSSAIPGFPDGAVGAAEFEVQYISFSFVRIPCDVRIVDGFWRNESEVFDHPWSGGSGRRRWD